MKHPLELEATHVHFETPRIALDVACGGLIAFGLRQFEQLGGIGDCFGRPVELVYCGREPRALATQLLGPLGIGPDGRILELAPDFLEALFLAVVLKETPEES